MGGILFPVMQLPGEGSSSSRKAGTAASDQGGRRPSGTRSPWVVLHGLAGWGQDVSCVFREFPNISFSVDGCAASYKECLAPGECSEVFVE